MPIVRVEDFTERGTPEQTLLIESLYASLREAMGVSDQELQARYTHLHAGQARTPGDRPCYLQITITLFQGRSVETKRILYRDIVDRLQRQGLAEPDDVLILLDEQPPQNWGMQGGQLASDLDFGYRIDI